MSLRASASKGYQQDNLRLEDALLTGNDILKRMIEFQRNQ